MYHCLVQTFLVISVKVECELFHDHCDRLFPECETAWLVLSCSVCPVLLHAAESSLFGAARYAVELSLAVVTDRWRVVSVFLFA